MKIGRNDPCWCGSGKKFKKCHYRRSDESEISKAEILAAINKGLSSYKSCLCPSSMQHQCTGSIIKAHSLSRSATLDNISEDHHVMSFGKNPHNLYYRGAFKFDKISVKSASTFTGFCSKHDRDLFMSIDNASFIGTQEQTACIAARTICREIFAKEGAIKTFSAYVGDLDRGTDIESQILYQDIRQIILRGHITGRRDINIYRDAFEKVFTDSSKLDIRYVNICFDGTPMAASAGVFTISHDANLVDIQDINNHGPQHELMAYAILPLATSSVISFAWLPSLEKHARTFILSMLTGNLTFGTCIWLSILYVENTFFRSSFINSLNEDEKNLIAHTCHFAVSHEEKHKTMRAKIMLEQKFPSIGRMLSSRLF